MFVWFQACLGQVCAAGGKHQCKPQISEEGKSTLLPGHSGVVCIYPVCKHIKDGLSSLETIWTVHFSEGSAGEGVSLVFMPLRDDPESHLQPGQRCGITGTCGTCELNVPCHVTPKL